MAKTRGELLKDYLIKQSEKAKNPFAHVVMASQVEGISYIKTGIPEYDVTFGGLPRGRHVIWYGGQGGGKSTMVLKTIANLQKQGLGVFLAEPEETFEPIWAAKQGVDLDALPMTRETSYGKVMDGVLDMVSSGYTDVIFIDSLAALKFKELDKKSTEDDFMALMARRLSASYFPRVTEPMAKNNVCIVYISQRRSNMDPNAHVERYPGGNALEHFLSMAINLRRGGTQDLTDKGERFKSGGEWLGFYSVLKAIKSKMPGITEGKKVGLSFMFEQGFNHAYGLFDLAVQYEVMSRKGPHYSMIKPDKMEYTQMGLANVIHDLETDETLRNNVVELLVKKGTETPAEEIKEEDFNEQTVHSPDAEPDQAAAEGTVPKAARKKPK
jgi:recombination protein RecA